MELILKFKGGSHAYGLQTPESDVDWRGVFLHSEPKYIIGLDRYEHQEDTKDGKDEKYKEFRAFLNLLRNANSEAIESLFINESDTEIYSETMMYLRDNRAKLLDSQKLFKCLSGYIHGEKRLANGERTGKLGSKRKNAIELYGFSQKNFCQLIRLAWAGCVFFRKGYFPVNIKNEDEDMHNLLFDIKTRPERYTKDGLNFLAEVLDSELKQTFDERNFDYKFDLDFANELCFNVYLDKLNKL